MLELGIPNNRKFKENFEKYKQDTKNKKGELKITILRG